MKCIKNGHFAIVLLLILTSTSCSDDDSSMIIADPFVVAFENLSANLGTIEDNHIIPFVYSIQANEVGQFELSVSGSNATYGEDFITIPEAINGVITLNIEPGTTTNTFQFQKISSSFDETTEIIFTISEVSYPNSFIQGNTSYTLNSEASLGRGFSPTVGGPNQQNQVYIDLSTENQKVVKRDTWDLGFYSGNEFRVGINGSIYMAAAQLENTNIDEVNEGTVQDIIDQVAVGTFDSANVVFIDFPDGDITKTAIASVSANPQDNKVYLLNLGYEVGTELPNPGSVAIAGDKRGWKKIRILQENDSYRLQYADLNDTNHQEVLISKNSSYNFTFFSFTSDTEVSVEPKSENWDINFSVFTNVLESAGSYGFSDGVLHNRKGGVRAYSVLTDDIAYDDFQYNDVIDANFQLDQRTIGSSWREVITDDKILVDNIYYIIEDPNGNIYKLKFTALLNESGERGFPEFKYNLIE